MGFPLFSIPTTWLGMLSDVNLPICSASTPCSDVIMAALCHGLFEEEKGR